MSLNAFSSAGPLTPFGFAARSFSLSAVLSALSAALVAVSSSIDQSSDDTATVLDGLTIVGILLIAAPLVWLQVCTYAKRLHDVGASGWHVIWILGLPVMIAVGPNLVHVGDLTQAGMAGIVGLLLWLALATMQGKSRALPLPAAHPRRDVGGEVASPTVIPTAGESAAERALPSPSPVASAAEQLVRLKGLLDAGAIDGREFKLLKDDLMSRRPSASADN